MMRTAPTSGQFDFLTSLNSLDDQLNTALRTLPAPRRRHRASTAQDRPETVSAPVNQPDFLHTMDGVDDFLRKGLMRDDLSRFFPRNVVFLPDTHPDSWRAYMIRLKARLIAEGKWPAKTPA